MHEYRNVPGCINGVNIQDRFDMAINDILEHIKNTTTPHQFSSDMICIQPFSIKVKQQKNPYSLDAIWRKKFHLDIHF